MNLEHLAQHLDTAVEVTVDHADADWHGHVGVVPSLIPRAKFDPREDVCIRLRTGSDDAIQRERVA